MSSLAIIIPTYKRSAMLLRCLEHLAKQTIAHDVDVIVVSDGHDEQTARLCQTPDAVFTTQYSSFRFIEIPKSHQGAARNAGVKLATAPYVLFIGDDILLAPDACSFHLNVLRKNRESRIQNPEYSQFLIHYSTFSPAVLGFTTWDPACSITPVMRWLEQSGWQFGYPQIARYAHQFLPPDIQHRFSYTSHISLPTKIARLFPFREDVTLYGWEDIEWGWRLQQAGVQLFYQPDARALHHHHMTLEESLKRMETLGQSAMAIENICPQLNVVPKGLKRLLYRAAALLPTMAGRHRGAFLSGINTCNRV